MQSESVFSTMQHTLDTCCNFATSVFLETEKIPTIRNVYPTVVEIKTDVEKINHEVVNPLASLSLDNARDIKLGPSLKTRIKIFSLNAIPPTVCGMGIGAGGVAALAAFIGSPAAGAAVLKGAAVGGIVGAGYSFYRDYETCVEIQVHIYDMSKSEWPKITQTTQKIFKDYIAAKYSVEELDSVRCPLTGELFIYPVKASNGVTYEFGAYSELAAQKGVDGQAQLPIAVADNPFDRLTLDTDVMRNVTNIFVRFLKSLKTAQASVEEGYEHCLKEGCDDVKEIDEEKILGILLGKGDRSLTLKESTLLHLGIKTYRAAITQRTKQVFTAGQIGLARDMNEDKISVDQYFQLTQELTAWFKETTTKIRG